jgi:hypothetical protein
MQIRDRSEYIIMIAGYDSNESCAHNSMHILYRSLLKVHAIYSNQGPSVVRNNTIICYAAISLVSASMRTKM